MLYFILVSFKISMEKPQNYTKNAQKQTFVRIKLWMRLSLAINITGNEH